MRRGLLILAGLLLLCPELTAQEALTDPELLPPAMAVPKETRAVSAPGTPKIIRWMVHPQKRGMFLNIPIIDTDPNRGVTVGVMPIWVIQEKNSDRIEQIHAPSMTYNSDFSFVPTYRYFYYPAKDAALAARGSFSVKQEREVFLQYQDRTLFGRRLDFSILTQYNVDGSNRFFGLGPNSPKSAESNYTENVIQYDLAVGVPLVPETRWMIHLDNRWAGERIYRGKITSLPSVNETFPAVVTHHRRGVNESRLIIAYDSRDDAITTSEGAYLQAFAGASVDSLVGDYDYTRYGLDGRYFHKWTGHDGEVTAANLKYEQLLGDAPFWLQSRLGGKYSLRAYGEGRYADRGSLLWNVEHRHTFYKAKMAGVTTEFELAPFAGLGTVFDNPGRLASRYVRPLVGLATRAIARPQVVGSIDFGYGQEGLATFMDINYSF